MSLSTKSGKQAVQAWAEEIGKEYGIEVKDLTTSFEDGLLLCAIIHYYEPQMLDFDSLDLENPTENLNLAFDVAAEKLVIETDLDAADFSVEDPKKAKELYKFICHLFKMFNPDHPILKKKKKVGKKSIKKKKSLKKKDGDNKELKDEDDEKKDEEKKDEEKKEDEVKAEEKKDEVKVEEKKVEEKKVQEKKVEEEKKEEKKEEEICEECEEGVAEKWCEPCGTKQCADCATHLHKLKKRKGHPIISLAEYYAQDKGKKKEEVKEEVKPVSTPVVEDDGRGRCDKHTEMKLVAYCKTCDEPICTTCMLKTHDGHEKQDLDSAKPENLKEYGNLLDEMKQSLGNYQNFKSLLEKNETNTRDTLKDFFKKVRTELDKKEASLLKALADFHKSNNERLVTDINDKNSLIGSMQDEQKFVEQLKLKIKAKSAIKEMNENSTSKFCDGYCFEQNDLIIDYINKFLIIIENANKLSLKEIKNGSKPSEVVTKKIDPLNSEKKEEPKTEEKKVEETKTEEKPVETKQEVTSEELVQVVEKKPEEKVEVVDEEGDESHTESEKED